MGKGQGLEKVHLLYNEIKLAHAFLTEQCLEEVVISLACFDSPLLLRAVRTL